MVAALIFQRFQIEAADPTYDLSKLLQELQEST